MKELKIEATIENLAKVFVFLQESLDKCDCTPKVKRQIKLCVEEIFMNITHYAYNPETGPAVISVDTQNDGGESSRIVISFADEGKPYDPLKTQEPDIDAELDDRRIGGLGVFLVKTTMDDVEYEHKDGQNVLTIAKKLNDKVG